MYSNHHYAQAAYEEKCRQANASNQDARAKRRKSIEDSLVEGGLTAIEEYENLLRERWEKASCLAEFDGVSMGFAIAQRARCRLRNEMTKE